MNSTAMVSVMKAFFMEDFFAPVKLGLYNHPFQIKAVFKTTIDVSTIVNGHADTYLHFALHFTGPVAEKFVELFNKAGRSFIRNLFSHLLGGKSFC